MKRHEPEESMAQTDDDMSNCTPVAIRSRLTQFLEKLFF